MNYDAYRRFSRGVESFKSASKSNLPTPLKTRIYIQFPLRRPKKKEKRENWKDRMKKKLPKKFTFPPLECRSRKIRRKESDEVSPFFQKERKKRWSPKKSLLVYLYQLGSSHPSFSILFGGLSTFQGKFFRIVPGWLPPPRTYPIYCS